MPEDGAPCDPGTAASPLSAASVLMLAPALRERIVAHLRAALPNEGVGLLAVERDQGCVMPRQFYPGTNVKRSPVRYQMDWAELVAALRDIDANGWDLGVIVHSHIRGPAVPSATDLAEAWYPDALMLIASFATEPPDLRAWTLAGEPGAWLPQSCPIVPMPPRDEAAGIAPAGEHRE